VANGVVYVGSFDRRLYAFDAGTGAPQPGWPVLTGGLIGSSPAVANSVVYVGSADGNIYAYETTQGFFLWAAATGGQIFLSSPAVADGAVYVGSRDGMLHAYNLAAAGM
jgi:outer membrane protein assembly factor BamB